MTVTDSIVTRLRNVLRNTYFFQSLKMHELDELIGHLRMVRAQEGYEIIKQGDSGDTFYLIASGSVSVWKKGVFTRKKIAELKADGFFGEMALISNEPRNATVVAEEITELFILQRHDFDKILMKNPAIAQAIKRAFFERKEQTR